MDQTHGRSSSHPVINGERLEVTFNHPFTYFPVRSTIVILGFMSFGNFFIWARPRVWRFFFFSLSLDFHFVDRMAVYCWRFVIWPRRVEMWRWLGIYFRLFGFCVWRWESDERQRFIRTLRRDMSIFFFSLKSNKLKWTAVGLWRISKCYLLLITCESSKAH
jgi:hypothetical protein